MNSILDFIQNNPLGTGGIAAGFLAVLFLLSRLLRLGTVDISDPGRAYRGGGAAKETPSHQRRKNLPGFLLCSPAGGAHIHEGKPELVYLVVQIIDWAE